MEKSVFLHLCRTLTEDHGLQGSSRVPFEEAVAIFLYIVGGGKTNRDAQDRFEHSGDTISRYFSKVLMSLLRLATVNVRGRRGMMRETHPKIQHDTRYWPFFRDAVGAIDGTHIPCIVPMSQQIKYIGRKGSPTMNVLAVCDWDMRFTWAHAGWEGTTHDARMFNTALARRSLKFPHPPNGKYYLVDSGFPFMKGFITPYRRVRYHLADYRRRFTFANGEEKFNYLHSSLRSTIERAFGVLKQKFRILRLPQPYSYGKQVGIVVATLALHNFIREHMVYDEDFIHYSQDEFDGFDDDDDDSEEIVPDSSTVDETRDQIRDEIVRLWRPQ
jgi:DDE superfamily endonuclease